MSAKYQQLGRSVLENQLVFSNENFVVEPLVGEVWPNSSVEFIVSFFPKMARGYQAVAYCELTGCAERLPLHLKGEGVGPQAVFSFDTLNLGEVYQNAVHRYSVLLENTGEIEAPFKLVESRSKKTALRFTPSQGVLKPRGSEEDGSSVLIQIEFCSKTLGEFLENVEWCLENSLQRLSLQFKGRVIAPNLSFSRDQLNFGRMSAGFPVDKEVSLTNSSKIPVKYYLKVQGDESNEFTIVPERGFLLPNSSVLVQLSLNPSSAAAYKRELSAYAEDVDEPICRVPLVGTAEIIELQVERTILNYENCFIGLEKSASLTIINGGSLKGRFEILSPDRILPTDAIARPATLQGTVDPYSAVSVPIYLTAQSAGIVNQSICVSIPGSDKASTIVRLTANAFGPSLLTNKTAIDFGAVRALQEFAQIVEVKNNSPIVAPFKAFVHKKNSAFSISPISGEILPGATKSFEIKAFLEDVRPITDIAHIQVQDSPDIDVALKAVGVGTTLHSDRPLEEVDLGPVFTGTPCCTTFTIENRGRKSESIQWIRVPQLMQQSSTTRPYTPQAPSAHARAGSIAPLSPPSSNPSPMHRPSVSISIPSTSPQMKLSSPMNKGRANASVVAGPQGTAPKFVFEPTEIPPTFTIVPEKAKLEPQERVTFTIEGVSKLPFVISESWVCKAQDNKNRFVESVFSTIIKASFTEPLLEFQPMKLNFLYFHDPERAFQQQVQSVMVKNTSSLPVAFSLKCPPALALSKTDVELQPLESSQGLYFF